MSEVDVDPEKEGVVIEAEPGLLDGIADYWDGQAPRVVLDGAKQFPVDAEAVEAEWADVEADDESVDRAMNALAWKLYSCKVSDYIRKRNEQERRRRADESVDPAPGEAPERPDAE